MWKIENLLWRLVVWKPQNHYLKRKILKNKIQFLFIKKTTQFVDIKQQFDQKREKRVFKS